MAGAPKDDLIDGGFRAPAKGTGTLLLRCLTLRAVGVLRVAFLDVTAGRGPIDLVTLPIVQLEGVAHLELRLTQNTLRKRMVRSNPDSFVWAETADDWLEHTRLLDSFVRGGRGHHYLTSAQHNDAVVEVSYGEAIPLKPKPL
jgi:hypothetical protein